MVATKTKPRTRKNGEVPKPKRVTLHPACKLFPPLDKEELAELAADIKQHGLIHPIVLHDNAVLDGRNRLKACKLAKVEPRFIQWDKKGSPTEYVISENIRRPHLNSSSRAVLALELLPLLSYLTTSSRAS